MAQNTINSTKNKLNLNQQQQRRTRITDKKIKNPITEQYRGKNNPRNDHIQRWKYQHVYQVSDGIVET